MFYLKSASIVLAHFAVTDSKRSVIEPLLSNKARGKARVDDWCILSGIFWRLITGAPWADIPVRYSHYTICVIRFNRWRYAEHWARIINVISAIYDGDIQMINGSSIRVHQYAASVQKRQAWGWLYSPHAKSCQCTSLQPMAL